MRHEGALTDYLSVSLSLVLPQQQEAPRTPADDITQEEETPREPCSHAAVCKTRRPSTPTAFPPAILSTLLSPPLQRAHLDSRGVESGEEPGFKDSATIRFVTKLKRSKEDQETVM
ncbi:hypothetical protein SKAU_G00403370 [Synaphobranchus kaupii]|uniref:Uncharacterized protein n=1 Tax=Synaphobranchus kaupii TaxID=118154 RepID=A0A9Q1E9H0_SYNKA|nr:hypothetical protein SKAU_G00403370 [Synaphobranchus kaupii]